MNLYEIKSKAMDVLGAYTLNVPTEYVSADNMPEAIFNYTKYMEFMTDRKIEIQSIILLDNHIIGENLKYEYPNEM